MTIILCDDEESILRVLSRLLSRLDGVKQVLACQGYEEAFAALTECPDAHLVTDYHLGAGYTGCDLIRQLVAAGYARSRVAVVSGGIIDVPLACAGRTIRLWTKPLCLDHCAELITWLGES